MINIIHKLYNYAFHKKTILHNAFISLYFFSSEFQIIVLSTNNSLKINTELIRIALERQLSDLKTLYINRVFSMEKEKYAMNCLFCHCTLQQTEKLEFQVTLQHRCTVTLARPVFDTT